MKRLAWLFFVTLPICLMEMAVGQPGLTPPGAANKDWAQWRGSDGSGVSAETGLVLDWNPGKNILWKTPLAGLGHSSPVVWGNRIFLTSDVEGEVLPGAKAVTHIIEGKEYKHPDSIGADRRHSLKVICLDRDTGKILWERTAYDGKVHDDRHRKGSYAAATAATDGTYVYVWFGTEGMYCYDYSGKQVWKASMGPLPTVGMGPGTSPVLFQDLVLLQCDEDNGDNSFLAGLDKRTGKVVWKTPRKVEASWATPLLVRSPKGAELVCSGNQWIISYDPATGRELWRLKGHSSNAIGTPVTGLGMVFVYAGYPQKRTFAIRLGASGDLTGSSNIAWTYDRGTAYVPSSILYGDYIYLMSDRGLLTCLDAKTGAVQYDDGRVPIPATFTASPVVVDGKILLVSEDGDTFVIKTGPRHEVLATNSIDEPVFSSPAISQGRIFLRGEKHLYCVGKRGN
jgi:outer membrane protein assembly factor BamB